MAVAKIQQLDVVTVDKAGMLAEVSEAIAAQNINIEAICAHGKQGNAVFYVVTADNARAKEALKSKGWRVKEEDAIMIDLDNTPGALQALSARLREKGVNLLLCYGSTCAGGRVPRGRMTLRGRCTS